MTDSAAKTDGDPLLRSTELMNADDTALLVVDVQEKLIGSIRDNERVVWNIRRLLDGADTLGVSVAGTEQYPQGLGATVEPIASRLSARPTKMAFSCGACGEVFADWQQRGIHRILVTGIEAHVCVQLSALDLLGAGFRVYVATDAVGSRYLHDYEVALRRLEASGAVLTTAEAALFEWCVQAGTPQFKAISALAKEQGP